MSTRPYRRMAAALGLLALVAGAALPAGAARSPLFLLEGGDHWFTHDSGYPVVLGPAELQVGKRTVAGDLAANIHPDDSSMPGPGECVTGLAFVWVQSARGTEASITSAGEVCGHHLQPTTSVVAHTFTGVAYIEASETKRFSGKEGFLEIRLAEDGRAHVFATAP